MGYLRLRKLKYEGDHYFYETPEIDSNIFIVEGVNGTGKTTFFNLLYHGLSGRVDEFQKKSKEPHLQITGDTNNFIELDMDISSKYYILRRFINDGDVTVIPYEESRDERNTLSRKYEKPVILPIHRTKEKPYTFSDWLLEKLNISVVELSQGNASFKLNFTDLARLIYHDQSPDPNKIFKGPDSGGYITESETLRKAIFQLLIGKAFSEYYSALNELKKAEKDESVAYSVLQEYERLADEVRGKKEKKNILFITKEIENKENQIESLEFFRKGIQLNRMRPESSIEEIENFTEELFKNEMELKKFQSLIFDVYKEKSKLVQLQANISSEVEQINKIILSHDKLNLFSPDTCPYCLSEVSRPHGQCVCGSTVDESQYERFFYNSIEYKDILKSKLKSLETVTLALMGCEDEEAKLTDNIEKLRERALAIRDRIKATDNDISNDSELNRINELDDKILQTRTEIEELSTARKIEEKLSGFQAKYDSARQSLERARNTAKELEALANQEIHSKIGRFSSYYETFMRQTLIDCRTARIDSSDYLPIINNGEYREASSGVSKRLMFYLTLLQMSLLDEDVPYPRFLMIDTPETAGIDAEKLTNALDQLNNLESTRGEDFQVILSTGLGKYPASLSKYVGLTLTEHNRLLREK